jgi:putative addiction module component (TIGR02574 family)
LAEVQAKLDELTGDGWIDNGELTEADKAALDAGLAEYQKTPNAGNTWEHVEARIRAKLQR